MDSIALNKAVSQDLAVLNGQVGFHKKRAEATKDNPSRSRLHVKTANDLQLIADHEALLQARLNDALSQIEILQTKLTETPNPLPTITVGQQLTLSLDDIRDLPEELVKELSIDTNSLDFIISNLVNDAGGILSLDKILIGLYKKTGEIHKRTPINNRIYRMTQRGELFPIPGKRAAYATRPLTPDEIESLSPPPKDSTPEEDLA